MGTKRCYQDRLEDRALQFKQAMRAATRTYYGDLALRLGQARGPSAAIWSNYAHVTKKNCMCMYKMMGAGGGALFLRPFTKKLQGIADPPPIFLLFKLVNKLLNIFGASMAWVLWFRLQILGLCRVLLLIGYCIHLFKVHCFVQPQKIKKLAVQSLRASNGSKRKNQKEDSDEVIEKQKMLKILVFKPVYMMEVPISC